MHLLTAEAIALYATKLKPEGAGVLHISNRYLDLEAVLATTIPKVAGLHTLVIEDDTDDGYTATGSTVVVFGKSMQAIDLFRGIPGARNIHESGLQALDRRLVGYSRTLPVQAPPRGGEPTPGCTVRAGPL